MLRTRVGYSGGTKDSPTYRSMGDHSEAIQIDFDPEQISYEELLGVFLGAHNPCRAGFLVQYRSAVFFHSEEQREAALKATRSYEMQKDDKVATGIEAFTSFTNAEDYHQKYLLRSDSLLMAELEQRYPTIEEFLASPTVTRANAFVGGHGSQELRSADLPRMGFTPEAIKRMD